MIRKRLLICGCARSGTRYAAALMQAAGLKVKHEKMDEDGIVTSFFAADMPKQRLSHEGVRSEYLFDHVWHLVRHPLPWARSIHIHLGEGYWRQVQRHTGVEVPYGPDRRPHRAWPQLGQHWVRWNRLIEAQRPEMLIRLEEMASYWPEMMRRLGLSVPFPTDLEPIGHEPRWTNLSPEVTWEMLGPAQQEVRDMARAYGYEVD